MSNRKVFIGQLKETVNSRMTLIAFKPIALGLNCGSFAPLGPTLPRAFFVRAPNLSVSFVKRLNQYSTAGFQHEGSLILTFASSRLSLISANE